MSEVGFLAADLVRVGAGTNLRHRTQPLRHTRADARKRLHEELPDRGHLGVLEHRHQHAQLDAIGVRLDLLGLGRQAVGHARPVLPELVPEPGGGLGEVSRLPDEPVVQVPAEDRRLLETLAMLRETSFVHGGFFQDMIHSGINAYLTLHAAQVMLRAGDPEWFALVEAVALIQLKDGRTDVKVAALNQLRSRGRVDVTLC